MSLLQKINEVLPKKQYARSAYNEAIQDCQEAMPEVLRNIRNIIEDEKWIIYALGSEDFGLTIEQLTKINNMVLKAHNNTINDLLYLLTPKD